MNTMKADAATLRSMAKICGLKNVRIRKGKGCRSGNVHAYLANEATREDRIAFVAFLRAVEAVCMLGYSCIDLQTCNPLFIESVTVVSHKGA